MIDRQGNRVLIECDICDQVFQGEEREDFAATWASAKREGWKTRQIAGEWLHGCPKCGVPS